MIIRTSKYQLAKSTYIKLGLKNIVRQQFWVILIYIALIALSVIFLCKTWVIVTINIALILYFAFWVMQFYGVSYMESNSLMFDQIRYEITSQQILLMLTTKKGMPVLWSSISKAYVTKKYFLLIISKAHIIHLPYKIFSSTNEVKFLTTILKRKNLIK